MKIHIGDQCANVKYLLIPYSVCFALVLVLACLFPTANPTRCPDGWLEEEEADGCFDIPQALYLLLTTLHAASWGHLVPWTPGQRTIVCLVSAIGYLWPLITFIGLLVDMRQRALAKLASVTLLASYLGLAVLGSLVFAGILAAADEEFPFDMFYVQDSSPFGSSFYVVWMTFHMRAYGEAVPSSSAGQVVCLLVVMVGSLCWVAPVLLVARRCLLDPGTSLFSMGADGGFRGMLGMVVRSIALPYGTCFFWILVLAGIHTAAGDQCPHETECNYGNDLQLLLQTFHGVTYGHVYPISSGQRVAAGIAASLGYLWRQIALLLLLREMKQPTLARRYGTALAVCYASMAVLGGLALAAVNAASARPFARSDYFNDARDFGASFYYVWMTYNGRAFGDLSPKGSAGQEVVGIIAALAGNLGWIWPLLLALRASLLRKVLESVRPGPEPDVIGAVAAPTV